jgi:hypothetical protein
MIFLLTAIYCGIADFISVDIAFISKPANNMENIHLSLEFWEILDD